MSDPVIRSFADAIAVMEEGTLHHDLTEMQNEVIATLQNEQLSGARKPKGQITLTIDYKLEDGVMDIQSKIKSKLPEASRGRTVLFVTPENNLSRANPRQRDIFEDVNAGKSMTVETA